MTPARCARAREALLAAVDEFAAAEGAPWTARVAAPPSDDWSLAPESLRFLVALVRHLAPRHVLEFGSGRSTTVIGRACADLPTPATLRAIENDPVYLDCTRAAVAADGLDATVHVVPASLVTRRCHGRMVPVYLVDPQLVDDGPAPDLVLVDGPPQPLGGREGAMYQALHAAHEGTLIALDDSRRGGEQAVLTRSLQLYEGHLEAVDLLGFSKGLALLVVVEPVDPLHLPEELRHGP